MALCRHGLPSANNGNALIPRLPASSNRQGSANYPATGGYLHSSSQHTRPFLDVISVLATTPDVVVLNAQELAHELAGELETTINLQSTD